MSIKIEGGGGSKENVFSDSDSGMPLWNGAPLLNLVYPVGSIYLSSKNTNPATLFGGTWVQIKDRFILAAGDYYSNGATGGAATVTLTVSNMPSHSHSFTPSGTVGSHSHSFTPSGTVGSHTHTGPSHSHSFTPSGTVSSHSHAMSSSSSYIGVSDVSSAGDLLKDDGDCGAYNATGHWRFRKYLFVGNTGNAQPSFSGTAGTTDAAGTGNTGETAPSFTGTAGNTGETAPSFSGTAGYTGETAPSFTGTAGYTGSNGSGSSFSILPPYIVKYCWERTA